MSGERNKRVDDDPASMMSKMMDELTSIELICRGLCTEADSLRCGSRMEEYNREAKQRQIDQFHNPQFEQKLRRRQSTSYCQQPHPCQFSQARAEQILTDAATTRDNYKARYHEALKQKVKLQRIAMKKKQNAQREKELKDLQLLAIELQKSKTEKFTTRQHKPTSHNRKSVTPRKVSHPRTELESDKERTNYHSRGVDNTVNDTLVQLMQTASSSSASTSDEYQSGKNISKSDNSLETNFHNHGVNDQNSTPVEGKVSIPARLNLNQHSNRAVLPPLKSLESPWRSKVLAPYPGALRTIDRGSSNRRLARQSKLASMVDLAKRHMQIAESLVEATRSKSAGYDLEPFEIALLNSRESPPGSALLIKESIDFLGEKACQDSFDGAQMAVRNDYDVQESELLHETVTLTHNTKSISDYSTVSALPSSPISEPNRSALTMDALAGKCQVLASPQKKMWSAERALFTSLHSAVTDISVSMHRSGYAAP